MIKTDTINQYNQVRIKCVCAHTCSGCSSLCVMLVCSTVVRSAAGLRLIELRQGSVCHHWEFFADNPPTEFTVSIDELRHLVIENDVEMVVVVEDNDGTMLKQKLLPDELRT